MPISSADEGVKYCTWHSRVAGGSLKLYTHFGKQFYLIKLNIHLLYDQAIII